MHAPSWEGASLELAQVVVQRLDVSEDTHGVRFTAHYHHVLDFDQTVTARFSPEEKHISICLTASKRKKK